MARDRPVLTAVFMAVFDAHAAVHIAGFIPTDMQLRTVFCLMAVIAERIRSVGKRPVGFHLTGNRGRMPANLFGNRPEVLLSAEPQFNGSSV